MKPYSFQAYYKVKLSIRQLYPARPCCQMGCGSPRSRDPRPKAAHFRRFEAFVAYLRLLQYTVHQRH